jgi:hypothetical protein
MTGSGDLKSQCKLRFGLGVGSDADARLIFDDTQMSDGVAALVHKGSMYVQHDESRPIPVKGYRVEHGEIYGLAQACSWLRPGVEFSLEDALGDAYAQRWSMERAGHLLTGAARKPRAADGTAAATATVSLPTIPPPPRAEPAWKTVDGTPIPRDTKHWADTDVDTAFRDLTRGLDVEPTRPHAGRASLLGLLEAAGSTGAGPSDLHRRLNEAGIGCVRQTVHGWLDDLVRAGDAVKRGGGVYVHRSFS